MSNKPVRISDEFLAEAKIAAEREMRSVPKQVEYWADIGKLVASVLDPSTLAAVRAGTLTVTAVTKPSRPVDVDQVLADLEHDRAEGTLVESVTRASRVYQVDPSDPERVQRIDAAGNRQSGQFVDGRFVAEQQAAAT